MQYPSLSGSSRYRMETGQLDGGVNRRDAPDQVADNQLTVCKNLWWQHGALRTRPGLKSSPEQVLLPKQDSVFTSVLLGMEDRTLDNQLGRRMIVHTQFADGSAIDNDYTPGCLHYDGSFSLNQNSVRINYDNIRTLVGGPMVMEGNGEDLGRATGIAGLDGGILKLPESEIYAIPSRDTVRPSWIGDKAYVPLVRVAARGVAALGDQPESEGIAYEGYNLLTPEFRCSFTTDGKATIFFLPEKELDTEGPITARYTNQEGTVFVHTVEGTIGQPQEDGLTMHCNRQKGYIYFTDGSGNKAPEAGGANNLMVTAPKTRAGNSQLFYGMRYGTWFGGDRSSLGGGTRLFLYGNSQYPHRMIWSDVNNPLYFPENNYVTVGDASQKITALAKQGSMLVIFKEREIYAATYSAGNYTSADVEAGTVGDVAAQAAVFPITQLHSGIGCDRPETIVLCANRLVWLHSSGGVYTLVSADRTSECNVRCLSKMVERELENLYSVKTCAGDYAGHYLLLVGSRALLLRYDDEAFDRIGSSVVTDKVEKQLKWAVWDFSGIGVEFRHLCARDDRAILVGYIWNANDEGRYVFYTLEDTRDTDMVFDVETGIFSEQPIPVSFRTKAFDFGRRESLKSISQILVGLEGPSGKFRFTYHTERGAWQDAAVAPENSPVCSSAGQLRLTPHLNRVREFSLQADGEGSLAVTGLTLRITMNR